jgi:hypothetical protein
METPRLNVKESMRDSPPGDYYDLSPGQYGHKGGITWIKRKPLSWDNIIIDKIQHQVRSFSSDVARIDGIYNDIRYNGYLHYKRPAIVYWDKELGKYVLISGFGRYDACVKRGYSHWMFDIVTGSPLDMHKLKSKAQPQTSESPMLTKDHQHSAKMAIHQNYMSRTESDLDAYFRDVLPSYDDSKIATLRNAVMKSTPKAQWLKTYDSKTAKEWLKTHSHPYKTDGKGGTSIYANKTALVKDGGNSGHYFKKAKDIFNKTGEPIYCHFWVIDPCDTIESKGDSDLKSQREGILSEFNASVENEYQYLANIFNKNIEDIKKEVVLPYRAGGFLPQMIKSNPNDKGYDIEKTLVDTNGKRWDYPVK